MGARAVADTPEKQPNAATDVVVRAQRLVEGRARPSGQPPGPPVRRPPRQHRHLTGAPLAGRRAAPRADPAHPVRAVLRALRLRRRPSRTSGLRSPHQPPGGGGIDLPWAGPQTVQLINEFSRSDLMLGRRGFLGTSLALSAGPALLEPMQRWLVPPPRRLRRAARAAGRAPRQRRAPLPAVGAGAGAAGGHHA